LLCFFSASTGKLSLIFVIRVPFLETSGQKSGIVSRLPLVPRAVGVEHSEIADLPPGAAHDDLVVAGQAARRAARIQIMLNFGHFSGVVI
jgi:hypothetical protein